MSKAGGGKEVIGRSTRVIPGDAEKRTRNGEELSLISPDRGSMENTGSTGRRTKNVQGRERSSTPTYEELKHLQTSSPNVNGAKNVPNPSRYARQTPTAKNNGNMTSSKAKPNEGATNSGNPSTATDKPSSSYGNPRFEEKGSKANTLPIRDQNVNIESANSNVNKQQTTVVTKDPTALPKKKVDITAIPQTNLAIGCLVAVCFNLPFGILAMYCSLRAASAYRDGDNKRGASRARTSIFLSLFGIALTMIIVSSMVVFFAVSRHSERKYRPQSGSALGL